MNYNFMPLLKASLFSCWIVSLGQIPTSAVAVSLYKFLEAFAKLEKRLSEGPEGSAATRGQPIHDIRNKLDKFTKALGSSEIQVCIVIYCAYVGHPYNYRIVLWNMSEKSNKPFSHGSL